MRGPQRRRPGVVNLTNISVVLDGRCAHAAVGTLVLLVRGVRVFRRLSNCTERMIARMLQNSGLEITWFRRCRGVCMAPSAGLSKLEIGNFCCHRVRYLGVIERWTLTALQFGASDPAVPGTTPPSSIISYHFYTLYCPSRRAANQAPPSSIIRFLHAVLPQPPRRQSVGPVSVAERSSGVPCNDDVVQIHHAAGNARGCAPPAARGSHCLPTVVHTGRCHLHRAKPGSERGNKGAHRALRPRGPA